MAGCPLGFQLHSKFGVKAGKRDNFEKYEQKMTVIVDLSCFHFYPLLFISLLKFLFWKLYPEVWGSRFSSFFVFVIHLDSQSRTKGPQSGCREMSH